MRGGSPRLDRGGGSAAPRRRPTRRASIRRGELQVGDDASHRRIVGGGSRDAGRERRKVMEVRVPLVSSTDRESREGLSPQVLDERTSFLGGSALMLWAQIASASGLFVAVLVLARGLGPEGRGTMAFISVAALVIGRVARIGAGEAVAILAAQRRSERSALLGALAVFVVPVTLIFAAAVAVVILSLPEPRPAGVEGTELVALVVGAAGLALYESCGMFLLGCKRFVARTVTGATAPWIYATILGILSATVGLTVASAAFTWAIAMSIGGLIGCWRSGRRRGSSSRRSAVRPACRS